MFFYCLKQCVEDPAPFFNHSRLRIPLKKAKLQILGAVYINFVYQLRLQLPLKRLDFWNPFLGFLPALAPSKKARIPATALQHWFEINDFKLNIDIIIKTFPIKQK